MKKVTRSLFLTKQALDLIDKDINAQNSYTLFSNQEQGTMEVEVTFAISEEFKITEDVLMDIVQGLTPALSEKEHDSKHKEIVSYLRSMGLSV